MACSMMISICARVWMPRLLQIGATQRDGDQLGAAGDECVPHQLVRRKFSGPNEQTRCELAIGDLQFRGLVGHWKKISEFRDTRECRCSTGILHVWPIGILPV